jgi:hypothetical protein
MLRYILMGLPYVTTADVYFNAKKYGMLGPDYVWIGVS